MRLRVAPTAGWVASRGRWLRSLWERPLLRSHLLRQHLLWRLMGDLGTLLLLRPSE